jgi:8-oxo-dGTP pyrophosphatase MutT (NUDIX family)
VAEETPIRLGATVVVLRDTPHGPEVLLVRRAAELAFHGGAWVFPGGRVDEEDFGGSHVQVSAPYEALAASRNAAVREAREESGLILDAAALLPVSHWTTPRGRPRRFATWFFAALLDRPQEIVIDGGEIRGHRWLRPQDALAARDAGDVELPAPTFVTLSVLSAFASSAHWFDALAEQEPPIYVPRPHIASHGVISLYQGDVAYDGGEVEREGPRHRLNMLESGWSYQRAPG